VDKPSSKKTLAPDPIAELTAKETVTVKELMAWCADRIAEPAVVPAMAEYNGLPHPPGGEKGLHAIDEAGLRAIDQITEEVRRAARAAWPRHRQEAVLEGLTLRAGPPTQSKH
jgi:hypothetical protein